MKEFKLMMDAIIYLDNKYQNRWREGICEDISEIIYIDGISTSIGRGGMRMDACSKSELKKYNFFVKYNKEIKINLS